MLASVLARLRQPEPAPPWKLFAGLMALLGYLLFQIVALAVVISLFEPGAAMTGQPRPAAALLAALLASGAALMILWTSLRDDGAPPFPALRLGEGHSSLWLVALFSLGVAIAVDFVALITATRGLPITLDRLAPEPLPVWLLAAAYTVIVQPVVETLLLQGMWYPALAARLGNLPAIVITALTFVAFQAFPPGNPNDPALWIEGIFIGLYVTAVRAHEGSTRSAIVARMMFGAFLMARALLFA